MDPAQLFLSECLASWDEAYVFQHKITIFIPFPSTSITEHVSPSIKKKRIQDLRFERNSLALKPEQQQITLECE